MPKYFERNPKSKKIVIDKDKFLNKISNNKFFNYVLYSIRKRTKGKNNNNKIK